jgi:hypothetical protein
MRRKELLAELQKFRDLAANQGKTMSAQNDMLIHSGELLEKLTKALNDIYKKHPYDAPINDEELKKRTKSALHKGHDSDCPNCDVPIYFERTNLSPRCALCGYSYHFKFGLVGMAPQLPGDQSIRTKQIKIDRNPGTYKKELVKA